MIEHSGTLLHTPDGKVILQRRDNNTKACPNMLGLFGGAAEPGEDAELAARRELQEETSLEVSKLIFKQLAEFVVEDKGRGHKVLLSTFVVIVPNANFNVYEGVGAEAYDPEDVLARDDLAESTRTAIMKFQEKQ